MAAPLSGTAPKALSSRPEHLHYPCPSPARGLSKTTALTFDLLKPTSPQPGSKLQARRPPLPSSFTQHGCPHSWPSCLLPLLSPGPCLSEAHVTWASNGWSSMSPHPAPRLREPSLRWRALPTYDEAVTASSHEHGLSLGGQVEVPSGQEG